MSQQHTMSASTNVHEVTAITIRQCHLDSNLVNVHVTRIKGMDVSGNEFSVDFFSDEAITIKRVTD